MAAHKLSFYTLLLLVPLVFRGDSTKHDAALNVANLDSASSSSIETIASTPLSTEGTTKSLNYSNSGSRSVAEVHAVDFHETDHDQNDSNHYDVVIGIVVVAVSLVLGSLLFAMWRCIRMSKRLENGDTVSVDKKEYHIPELDLEDIDEVMAMRRRESGCSSTSGTARQKRFASITVMSRELLSNHLRGTADRVESDESSLEMDSEHDEAERDCIDTDSDHGEGVEIMIHDD